MPAPIQTAGALRQRVRIERRLRESPQAPFGDNAPFGDDALFAGADLQDGYGNIESDWVTIVSPRAARIAPMRGREEVQAARLSGAAPFEIWLRRDALTATIAPEDRAVDQRTGRVFNIRWAENLDERRRYVLLVCEAGVAIG